MKKGTIIACIVAFAVLFIIAHSLYVVNMTEQVIVTQFGKPVGQPITKPGLKFKIPFIYTIHRFEKRLMEWDGNPNQIPTKDKKYIWVDVFARWKIIDPLTFMQSVGNEIGAHARLDDVIDAATRDEITSQILIEVVRNSNREMAASDLGIQKLEAQDKIKTGRSKLAKRILEQAQKEMPRYGIELVDVRIKRINYVEEVRLKVYARMISERQRIAEQYRSEGKGKTAEILGQKDKELQKIGSEAYRKAQILQGKADAEATRIYAEAYGRDPEFYSFLKTLESYSDTVGEDTLLILTTESDYFKLLKSFPKQNQ